MDAVSDAKNSLNFDILNQENSTIPLLYSDKLMILVQVVWYSILN